ncbi:hypothetical protein D7M15_08875 [Streptomyces sp. Z26]|nr:hypothetical protein D7M15_08875 [Streptomyces sp. Z26]
MTADWLRARVRVDAIQHDTLLALGRAWAEEGGEADIARAADQLAEALSGDPSPEELDARVQAVEDAAAVDDAVVEFGLADAVRLRDELDAVIAVLSRFSRPRLDAVPQQDRGAA